MNYFYNFTSNFKQTFSHEFINLITENFDIFELREQKLSTRLIKNIENKFKEYSI